MTPPKTWYEHAFAGRCTFTPGTTPHPQHKQHPRQHNESRESSALMKCARVVGGAAPWNVTLANGVVSTRRCDAGDTATACAAPCFALRAGDWRLRARPAVARLPLLTWDGIATGQTPQGVCAVHCSRGSLRSCISRHGALKIRRNSDDSMMWAALRENCQICYTFVVCRQRSYLSPHAQLHQHVMAVEALFRLHDNVAT